MVSRNITILLPSRLRLAAPYNVACNISATVQRNIFNLHCDAGVKNKTFIEDDKDELVGWRLIGLMYHHPKYFFVYADFLFSKRL